MQHFDNLDAATEEQLRLNNFEVLTMFYHTEVELIIDVE